jgi:hypothetical protein
MQKAKHTSLRLKNIFLSLLRCKNSARIHRDSLVIDCFNSYFGASELNQSPKVLHNFIRVSALVSIPKELPAFPAQQIREMTFLIILAALVLQD